MRSVILILLMAFSANAAIVSYQVRASVIAYLDPSNLYDPNTTIGTFTFAYDTATPGQVGAGTTTYSRSSSFPQLMRLVVGSDTYLASPSVLNTSGIIGVTNGAGLTQDTFTMGGNVTPDALTRLELTVIYPRTTAGVLPNSFSPTLFDANGTPASLTLYLPGNRYYTFGLDQLQTAPDPFAAGVPEPASFALAAAGVGLVLIRRTLRGHGSLGCDC